MEENSILPAIWEVPESFRDRLGATVGRQRTMFDEGHLLLILHAPPTPDNDNREGRFFWRNPTGEWRSSNNGGGVASIANHLDAYLEVLEACDESVETATNSSDYYEAIERLAPLHRAASNQHQVFQEARKLVEADRDLINLRDRAYQLERTAGLLYDGAKTSLDFAVARQTEDQAVASHQMAVAAHRLNVMASFFFPIATLSAIFGMNLQHGWEDSPAPFAFLVLLGGGMACGALLTRFVTGRGRT